MLELTRIHCACHSKDTDKSMVNEYEYMTQHRVTDNIQMKTTIQHLSATIRDMMQFVPKNYGVIK